MPARRGLVMTGGGVKGAFQVGALASLAASSPKHSGYEVVAGTSVGALNALALAHYEPGPYQLAYASRKLKQVWQEIHSNRNIFSLRFPPYVSAFWGGGIATTEPLLDLLERHCKPERIASSGVQVRITAVDLVSGKLFLFSEKDPNLLLHAVASSSFPLLFEPVTDRGRIFVDGAVRDGRPLRSVIDLGAEDVTLISCWNVWGMEPPTSSRMNAISVGIRCLSIIEHELLQADVRTCLAINRRVGEGGSSKRAIRLQLIQPERELGDSFRFNRTNVVKNFKAGYRAAWNSEVYK